MRRRTSRCAPSRMMWERQRPNFTRSPRPRAGSCAGIGRRAACRRRCSSTSRLATRKTRLSHPKSKTPAPIRTALPLPIRSPRGWRRRWINSCARSKACAANPRRGESDRSKPNASRARSQRSPKPCPRCAACASRETAVEAMTTTCLQTPTDSVSRLRTALTRLSAAGWTEAYLNEESFRTASRLHHDFAVLAHPHQEHREAGNDSGPWTTWLMLGGRGAGKTRTGAEWVRAMVHGTAPWTGRAHGRIALVGETLHDAREVMVEGESGLLRTSPREQRPEWIPTRKRLQWPNGAVGQVFSADDPQSLRGPQFEAAWCDELAKWRYAEATFDMLQFALRLGQQPRQLVTTTPRPLPLLKRLLCDPRTYVTRAPTRANQAFLSPAFLETVVGRYA